MNFQDKVKAALSKYKKESLNIQDAGTFRYKGKDLIKEHILPIELKNQNILQHYRDAFFTSRNSEIDFHKYFHHLNSSQALCINLFFPLMVESKLNLITDLLDVPETLITSACFEKESDIEVGIGRKTNFDYFLQLSDGTRIYFEIKYTEAEFGKAKKDQEHRKKFTATYLPLLEDNRFIKPEYCDVDAFLDSYQIMRNLSHIDDKSLVVFVCPKANKKIHSQVQAARENVLTDQGKIKFKTLLLEPTIDEILRQIETSKLQEHYTEFKEKYLNYRECLIEGTCVKATGNMP